MNPFKEIRWRPTRSGMIGFGKTMAIGFSVIGAIVYAADRFGSDPAADLFVPLVLAGCGLFVGLVSYIAPKLALPIYYIWHVAGATVGIVVSNLLLTLFYYLMLTPVALIYRAASGKDPLRLERRSERGTEWIDRKGPDSMAQYLKQY